VRVDHPGEPLDLVQAPPGREGLHEIGPLLGRPRPRQQRVEPPALDRVELVEPVGRPGGGVGGQDQVVVVQRRVEGGHGRVGEHELVEVGQRRRGEPRGVGGRRQLVQHLDRRPAGLLGDGRGGHHLADAGLRLTVQLPHQRLVGRERPRHLGQRWPRIAERQCALIISSPGIPHPFRVRRERVTRPPIGRGDPLELTADRHQRLRATGRGHAEPHLRKGNPRVRTGRRALALQRVSGSGQPVGVALEDGRIGHRGRHPERHDDGLGERVGLDRPAGRVDIRLAGDEAVDAAIAVHRTPPPAKPLAAAASVCA
jgi:hypothetical protein